MTTFNYITAVWSNGPGVISVAPEWVVASIERALAARISTDDGKPVRLYSDSERGLTMAILRSPKAAGSEPSLRDARRGSFCHVMASDHPGARSLTDEAATKLYESLYGTPLFEAVTEQERAFMFLEFPRDREAVTAVSAGQDLIEVAFGLVPSDSSNPQGVSGETLGRAGEGASRLWSDPLEPDPLPLSSLLRYRSQASRFPPPARPSFGTPRSSAELEGESLSAQSHSDPGEGASGFRREFHEADPIPLSFLLGTRSQASLSRSTAMPSLGAPRSRVQLGDEVSPESEETPKAEPGTDSREPLAGQLHSEMDEGEAAVALPPRRFRLVAFRVPAAVIALLAVSVGVGVVVGPILFDDWSGRATEARVDSASDKNRAYIEMKKLYGWRSSELEEDPSPRPLDTGLSPEAAGEGTSAAQVGVSTIHTAEGIERREAVPTADSEVAASSEARHLSPPEDPSLLEVPLLLGQEAEASAEPRGQALGRKRKQKQLMGRMQGYR